MATRRTLVIPSEASPTDEAFPERDDEGMTWADVAAEAGVDDIMTLDNASLRYKITGLGVVTHEVRDG